MRDEIHATLTVVTHSHDLAVLIDPAERTRRGDRRPGRRRAGVALAVILLPILAATVARLVLLWPSGAKPQSPLKFAAAGVSFPRGKVTAMTTGACAKSDTGSQNPTPVPTAGEVPICGTATVTITGGSGVGHAVSVQVPPQVVEAGVGAGVILMKTPASTGSPASYSLYDVQRDLPLVAMAVLFALVTIAVARRRGLFALLGLGFAAVVVVESGNAILARAHRSLCERQLCVSHVVMRVSDARMDRAITSHRHLIGLLSAGTKADFLAAAHDHLKVAHEQAGSVR